ncbi:hypothetical protein [Streptomyces anulatus]|uniref:hypothetical protein n=1 Tax=Streptomyces anulatus TaxID=1892 RepID=UPI0036D8289D
MITVGRSPMGTPHPKQRRVLHDDFLDLTAIRADLDGVDACFCGLASQPSA